MVQLPRNESQIAVYSITGHGLIVEQMTDYWVAAASSSLAKALSISSFLVALRASRRLRASLTLLRRASAWSFNILVRAFSALRLWMNSMSTRLFLNTLPLHFMYSEWYRWRSIFLASRYFFKRRRSTRMRRIQRTFTGIRALAVPLRLPVPVCRPFRRAMVFLRTRARECTATGLRMMSPSFTSLRIFWREFSLAISLVSLGSSQILFLPHFKTAAASRFCRRRVLILTYNV